MKVGLRLRSRRRVLVAAGALALAAASGAAYASAPPAASGAAAHPLLAAITSELGISAAELRSDLAGGQTLSEIAAANGQSASSLEQALLGAAQTRLDRAVAAGKLSAAAEQARLTRLGSRLGKLFGVKHPLARLGLALRLRQAVVRLSAQYAGLTPQQVRSDLRSGESLTQIATSGGGTSSGLEQAIILALRGRLDSAVAAGTLSAQREQMVLARIQTRLAALITASPAG